MKFTHFFLLMRFKIIIIEYKFCNPGLRRILLGGVTSSLSLKVSVPRRQID